MCFEVVVVVVVGAVKDLVVLKARMGGRGVHYLTIFAPTRHVRVKLGRLHGL